MDRRIGRRGIPGAGKLAIVESEAVLVRQVFDLYELHQSTRKVAMQLSGKWTGPALGNLLRNPVYAGRRAEPRRQYGKGTRITRAGLVAGGEAVYYRPKSAWTWDEGVYPAIVTPQQWDRVARLMTANCLKGGASLRRKRGLLFSRLLFCMACGQPFSGHRKWNRPTEAPYYLCSGHTNGSSSCRSKCANEKILIRAVCGTVKAKLEEIGGIATLRSKLMAEVENALTANQTDRGKLRRQLETLEQEVATARRGLLRLAEVSAEVYREAVADVEKMMKECEGLREQIAREVREDEYRQAWAEAVERTLAGLDWLADPTKLITLIDRIELDFRPNEKGRERLHGGVIQFKRIDGLPLFATFSLPTDTASSPLLS